MGVKQRREYNMKTLIVEDEFISRKLLQSFVSPYGVYGKMKVPINAK
jgi:hypothetical protein